MTKANLQIVTIGKQKTCVFAFGRFNPPHQGHEELVDRVTYLSSQLQAEPRIYLSTSEARDQDPLSFERKLHWAQLSFPRGRFFRAEGNGTNPIDSIATLHREDFESVVVVCGTERAQSFYQYFKKFNGSKIFNFKVVSISAIIREVDPAGHIKQSASLMRRLASEGDLSKFSECAASALTTQQKKELFYETRSALRAINRTSQKPGGF